MKELYSSRSSKHNPPYEIFNGEQTPHAEVPQRAERILHALLEADFHPQEVVTDVPSSVLHFVHTPEYLEFLRRTSQSLSDGEYKYPSVFQIRAGRKSGNALAQFGHHSFDMYTPIMNTTYSAAVESAALAYTAAHTVSEGQEHVIYALCRPPGHHAEKDQMGGYCYINNAAVAAQKLSSLGKVACLDVDFHHGNGTQHIFYDREDVLTVSLHAHPDWKFPHFSGYADETGEGKGAGKNFNLPLDEGTTDSQFQYALLSALDMIAAHKPETLVVSLGVDTHEADPIGGFRLTTEYFNIMASTIAGLQLPTVIVQEGGYNTQLLGDNVVSFLKGFDQETT